MDENVVIVVGSRSYKVSKRKLAERSRYFDSMFNGKFLERNKRTVNIKGIDCEAWEDILHYVNTGKIKPKPFNSILHKKVLKLLVASDMLLFPDIREVCLRSLAEILTAENSLEILEVSSTLEIPRLMRISMAVALWNADVITYSEGFYNLDLERVEGYLSHPGLRSTRGEWGVWEAVNRWIISGSDPEKSRNKYLPRLIKCLSLKHLSLTDLRTISLHEGVRSNAIVSAAVRGILDACVTAPEVDDFINRWRSMPQRRLPLVPAVVAKINVGSIAPSPYVVRFSQEQGEFVPFLRLDEVEKYLSCLVGFKVIAEGSKLYMLGGEIMQRQPSWYRPVWEYDQIVGYWNFLANLPKETRHAAACVLGSDLYVMGGFAPDGTIQDTVSKLSLRNKKWTACASLLRPMYAFSCCAFRGKIYAIKTEIYEYDPVLDKWELLDIDLPSGDAFHAAMTNGDYIFISGLEKNVYKFDPTHRKSHLVRVGSFVEECTQACLVDDYIYNVSQSSLGNYLTCERMDIRSGDRETLWKEVAGNEIDTFNPNHQHGCFPLLMYEGG